MVLEVILVNDVAHGGYIWWIKLALISRSMCHPSVFIGHSLHKPSCQIRANEITCVQKSFSCYRFYIYLPFLPFLPPPPPPGTATAGLSGTTADPCVAPAPIPSFFFPLRPPRPSTLVRSLFFNHRSGSGSGVTPTTTCFGIRDLRDLGAAGTGAAFAALDGCKMWA